MNKQVIITGIAAVGAAGLDLAAHRTALAAGRTALRPLVGAGFGPPWDALLGGWIEPRSLLARRLYAPATQLAQRLARDAMANAGLAASDLREAMLLVGSSRGNAAGWLEPWPGRRPTKLLAASNSMHGEIAAGVSIELGIRGPYHVLANGCSSGLDALGWGFQAIRNGLVRRALVVAVDLPLARPLLEAFRSTGALSTNNQTDPYAPDASGFLPAEGGAAFVVEAADARSCTPRARILGYWANSDALGPVGAPADGAAAASLLRAATLELGGPIRAVSPHATGTIANARAERAALLAAFPDGTGPAPTLHLFKPLTGHTLGASGALDAALLAEHLSHGELPANLPGLTPPAGRFRVPARPERIDAGEVVLKLSSGMGGRNALVALGAP